MNAEKNFYDYITSAPMEEKTISILTDNITSFALIFATSFFVISLLYNYGKTILQKQMFTADWSKIVGDLLIIFLIASYSTIFGTVDSLCNVFNNKMYHVVSTGIEQNTKTQFVRMVARNTQALDRNQRDYIMQHATSSVERNAELLDRIKKSKVILNDDEKTYTIMESESLKIDIDLLNNSFLSRISDGIDNFVNTLVTGTVQISLYAIKYTIVFLIIGVSYIFYLIGPLALVFSLIPIWSDKAGAWFSTWITCKLSISSFIIINGVYEALTMNVWQQAIMTESGVGYNEYETAVFVDLGLQITGIIIYFMVFWLTSQWVGSASAGKVLTTGMQMASMLAGSRFGGGTPTPSPSENLSKSLADSVANVGGKSLKDN